MPYLHRAIASFAQDSLVGQSEQRVRVARDYGIEHHSIERRVGTSHLARADPVADAAATQHHDALFVVRGLDSSLHHRAECVRAAQPQVGRDAACHINRHRLHRAVLRQAEVSRRPDGVIHAERPRDRQIEPDILGMIEDVPGKRGIVRDRTAGQSRQLVHRPIELTQADQDLRQAFRGEQDVMIGADDHCGGRPERNDTAPAFGIRVHQVAVVQLFGINEDRWIVRHHEAAHYLAHHYSPVPSVDARVGILLR